MSTFVSTQGKTHKRFTFGFSELQSEAIRVIPIKMRTQPVVPVLNPMNRLCFNLSLDEYRFTKVVIPGLRRYTDWLCLTSDYL